MNFRRKITLALAGLGLAAALGVVGCERGITTPGDPTVIPPTVQPTDKILVTVVVPTGVSPASIRITLRQSGVVVRDSTIANPVGTNTYTFGNLVPGGTYNVTVQGTGLMIQSALLTIVSEIPPRATITLQAIVTTSATEVVSDAPVTSAGTTITIPPPTDLTAVATGASSASVTVSGIDGTTTVALTNQTAVPVVVQNDQITSTVLSAVQINSSAAGGTAAVTLPLPISTTDYASAAGGTVDIMVYDFNTLTWSTLQQATINADGTVDATVTGLPADAIIAVGTTPTVQSALTTLDPLRTFSATDIDAARASGATAIADYELNPSVQYSTSGKIARDEVAPVGKVAIIAPPGNIPAQVWAQIAPLIAARNAQLHAWIFGGQTDFTLEFPPYGVQAQAEILRQRESFTFEFKFGQVKKVYNIVITFSNGRITIIHTSGTVTGD
jgi:hypothetical protein